MHIQQAVHEGMAGWPCFCSHTILPQEPTSCAVRAHGHANTYRSLLLLGFDRTPESAH
jgi:hypothetical protein